jgi:MFS family permease
MRLALCVIERLQRPETRMSTETAPSTAPTPAGTTPVTFRAGEVYRYYVVWVLCGVYTLNIMDRQLLAILVEPIRREFGLTDTHMGFLGGLAFALFYTTLGMPLARLADRSHRVKIIAISIAVWSVFTALTGFAKGFWHLLAARIGVGVGEAGCNPAAYSLIGDYFEPRRRATALSIYQMGGYAGAFAGLMLGGAIAQEYGWRAAFYMVGLPGLAVALLVKLTIREPPRGFSDPGQHTAPAPPALQVLRVLWAKRSFRHLSLAAALHNFAIYGAGNFYSAFLIRSHGLSLAEVGVQLAAVTLVGGVLGAYLGGLASDRLATNRRDSRYYLWVPAVLLVVGFPLYQLVYALEDSTLVMWLLIPAIASSAAYLAPSITATYGLVGVRERALASALLLLILNLIGLGFGPLLAGMLSDGLHGAFVERGIPESAALAEGLRWSLRIVVLVNIWSAFHYFRAARTLREESYSG